MYIGGVDSAGLHHLLWEIVDNAVDEVMNGHASRIVVTLEADGKTMSVSDNGRGIPVDVHPKTGKSARWRSSSRPSTRAGSLTTTPTRSRADCTASGRAS